SNRAKSSRQNGEPQLSLASAQSKTAAAAEAAAAGTTLGQLATALGFHASGVQIQPLEARSFAGPFEELRDATDNWQAKHGRRPRVFLVKMGPLAQHTARAAYAKNFFEVGGFEVVTDDGFQTDADASVASFRESGASIGVICSSDKLYPELVPKVARELRAAGARSVVLAGNPGDNEATWRDAGVDRFIFKKCDVLATLREMLQEEGVLTT
ncbi:MAG: methylmalonyl-CoA mutase, partial [Nitrospinae bacterium]|nr:methylmalonyl-CoA mutase [Nitrospinota bacterium]